MLAQKVAPTPAPPVVEVELVVSVDVLVVVPAGVEVVPRSTPPVVDDVGVVATVVVAPAGRVLPPVLEVELPPLLAVVVVVAVVEVPVEVWVVAVDVLGGTVRTGAPLVSVVVAPPLPHAASSADASTPASIAATARILLSRGNMRPSGAGGYAPSGSIRRPQCGQSLRSFCASWSQ